MIAVPIVLIGAYFAARETSTFAVRTIDVRGGTPALENQVRVALAPVVGTSLLALNRGAIERRVDALPAVVSTSYDRAFPHTLRVTVVPETPVAVLHRGKETWLVSARGRTIARIPNHTDMALPRIWVPTAAPVAAGAFLQPDNGGTAARVLALADGFPERFTTATLSHGELSSLKFSLSVVGVDLSLTARFSTTTLPHQVPASAPYLQ